MNIDAGDTLLQFEITLLVENDCPMILSYDIIAIKLFLRLRNELPGMQMRAK